VYCTLEDIKAHLPAKDIAELSNDGRNTINEDVVDAAINESGVLIDSMIGGRYSLPFQNVPPLLKNICINLSIYNLQQRQINLDDNSGMRKRYDNAMKLLEKIASGEILLGAPMPSESPGFFASSMVAGGPAQFTMATMGSL